MKNAWTAIACLLLAACGSADKPVPEANIATNEPKKPVRDNPVVDSAKAEEARKLVEEGTAKFNKALYDEALPLFEQAGEADARSAEAQIWLAETYNRKDRLSEAKLAYRAASKLSSDVKARLRLSYLAADMALKIARAKIKDGQFKLAAEQCRDALIDNPMLVEARQTLAEALFKMAQFEEAREQYNRVSEESTGAARQDALNWVGQCYMRLRNAAEAEKVFDGLIKEGYTANDVFAWRAACRKERKDYKAARTDFLSAIENASSEQMRKDLQAELKAVEALIDNAGKDG